MSEPTKVQCPACGEIVDEADLIVTETPEDWQENTAAVVDLDDLPEKYRDMDPPAVRSFVRHVCVHTECRACSERHVQ